MTDTLNPQPTPSFGGHFFAGNTPVYFEEDLGGGGAGSEPVTPAAVEPVTPAEPVITEPVTPAAEPVTPATPVTPAAPEPLADPDDGTIPEALRPYVKQLRDEAADRRVALKPFEDVFSAYEPEETEALLSVIGGLASDETQFEAATKLKAIVESILGDGSTDPNAPLTLAQLEAREKQQQQQAQQEAAVQGIIKEASDLGYPEGTREHRRLLDVAVHETKGDLKAAHEAMKAEKDAIIADYAKLVLEGKAKWPTLVPATGTTPADVSGEPPKTWEQARANAEARRKARFGQ